MQVRGANELEARQWTARQILIQVDNAAAENFSTHLDWDAHVNSGVCSTQGTNNGQTNNTMNQEAKEDVYAKTL